MGRLPNKKVILTGAGAGMGAAMMERFVAEGASVVAVSLTEEKLIRRVEAVGAGDRIIAMAIDVAAPGAADAIVEKALDSLGGLDVVVNNAGIGDGFQLAGEVEDEVWHRTLDVNLNGPMRLCRRAIPHFLEQGSGVFVTTSSIAASMGGRGGAAYTASKHAVSGLMKNIAGTYFDRGIRSNIIAPGWTATEMTAGAPVSRDGWKSFRTVSNLNPRVAEASEIAEVAVFLASDESMALNGATITADSGWSIR